MHASEGDDGAGQNIYNPGHSRGRSSGQCRVAAGSSGCPGQGGQGSTTTTTWVRSHVGVTAHTGPWDELLPQLCPCKGPPGKNMLSLLYTPTQKVKINPLSENRLIFPTVSLSHTTFFSCKYPKPSYELGLFLTFLLYVS